jgi:hypothetical protein
VDISAVTRFVPISRVSESISIRRPAYPFTPNPPPRSLGHRGSRPPRRCISQGRWRRFRRPDEIHRSTPRAPHVRPSGRSRHSGAHRRGDRRSGRDLSPLECGGPLPDTRSCTSRTRCKPPRRPIGRPVGTPPHRACHRTARRRWGYTHRRTARRHGSSRPSGQIVPSWERAQTTSHSRHPLHRTGVVRIRTRAARSDTPPSLRLRSTESILGDTRQPPKKAGHPHDKAGEDPVIDSVVRMHYHIRVIMDCPVGNSATKPARRALFYCRSMRHG